MKKKIIIVSHNLRIGGVERSLLGLLNSFDYSMYEVDLFLYKHDGDLLPLLPKEVNLLPENSLLSSWLIPLTQLLKQMSLYTLYVKLISSIKAYIFVKKNKAKADGMVYMNYLHRSLSKSKGDLSDKVYDLCISFLTPHYIAASKFKSKRKVAWIHTDYSAIGIDRKTELSMWSKYDSIVAVSDSSAQSFVEIFPSLKQRVEIIQNIMPVDFIRIQSQEDISEIIPSAEGYYTICSVGRFCDAKNFDNVPYICRKILDRGCNVKWYIIGYGGDEGLIRNAINEAKVQDSVIILGKKNNPYPYIKACDIYVQPSRYEGKAVTVQEAQILAKPVVITKYKTSSSQLKDGFDGIIVPLDNEGCADGIVGLIIDREKRNDLIRNCANSDFSNSAEIDKIYKIVNSCDN